MPPPAAPPARRARRRAACSPAQACIANLFAPALRLRRHSLRPRTERLRRSAISRPIPHMLSTVSRSFRAFCAAPSSCCGVSSLRSRFTRRGATDTAWSASRPPIGGGRSGDRSPAGCHRSSLRDGAQYAVASWCCPTTIHCIRLPYFSRGTTVRRSTSRCSTHARQSGPYISCARVRYSVCHATGGSRGPSLIAPESRSSRCVSGDEPQIAGLVLGREQPTNRRDRANRGWQRERNHAASAFLRTSISRNAAIAALGEARTTQSSAFVSDT